MAIDIVKKLKGSSRNKRDIKKVVDSKKQPDFDSKKNFEEKIESNFTNISKMADHQKIRIMWISVIFFSTLLIVCWFYLASKGVIINSNNKENDEFAILTTQVTENLSSIKNEFNENKALFNSLKKEIETSITKTEIVEKMKTEIEKNSFSSDFKVSYPLENRYINNPIRIIGKAKIEGSQFNVKLFDSRKKILGQTNGLTEKENYLSPFETEMSYSNPVTANGYLEFQTLSNGNEQTLKTVSVSFVDNLHQWTEYIDEEHGFKIKTPPNYSLKIMSHENGKNYLQLGEKKNITSKESAILPHNDSILINSYRSIDDFNENFDQEKMIASKSFVDFFDDNTQTILKTNKLVIAKSSDTESESVKYFFYNTLKDQATVIKANRTGTESETIFEQIISTFEQSDLDTNNWNIFEDEFHSIQIKYPPNLETEKNLDQTIFKTNNPEEFSFYIFSIEPKITNLEKWINESSQNLDETITSNENKVFGEIFDGIYYTSEEKLDETDPESTSIKNLGYAFNLNDATYFIKTSKTEYLNTFKSVLNSIKPVKNLPSTEILSN